MSDCTVRLSAATFLQAQVYRFCFNTNLKADAYFFRITQVNTKIEGRRAIRNIIVT
jgi:hypothetical protein